MTRYTFDRVHWSHEDDGGPHRCANRLHALRAISCASATPVDLACGSQLLENIMGKYVLGWLLGIPAIVLVVVYFFMH
jgi:hypothetical protein